MNRKTGNGNMKERMPHLTPQQQPEFKPRPPSGWLCTLTIFNIKFDFFMFCFFLNCNLLQ